MGGDSEQRAEAAENRLQMLVDAVRDYAIFLLDAHGRVQTWSRGAELIKGYTADEIIGQPLQRFYPPEDVADCKPQRLLEIARREGRVEDEGWRVRKDGSRFWADVVISANRDPEGALVGFVKVTRDLTAQRAADEQRRIEQQRFRTLVETATDYAIFALDPSGRVATWNQGAARIKGYRADEIIGQHFSKFYPPGDVLAGKCETELAGALRDGRFEDEGWRLRKDGSRFWANVVIQPLFDTTGAHIGFSKITRDLTERRNAELERLELARTQEALGLRDEFLSIAAHELRTPLSALQLQIDGVLASSANLDAKQISKLQRAGKNVARLTDLIAALLDVSRIAQGKLTLAPTHVDLAALVDDVIERLHESAAEARCLVVADLAPGIEGDWDALRIGQVVSNLLANAFKYARGTEVTVRTARDGDEATITVEDRGPGIPPEHLERVFGRWERAVPVRHYGGMGLGLFVAREIVTAHGGTIRAENIPEGGAKLLVRLPIRRKDST